jgi:hypothetical protein
MSIRIQPSAVLLGFLATLLLASASGCRHWNIFRDDDGFPRDEQKLTKDVRPAETNNKPWATSEKGREIESNLGVGPR